MTNHATSQFWKLFARLPDNIQDIARKQFDLFEQDINYPSLQFKQLSGTRNEIWSARINDTYRVLALHVKDAQKQDVWIWFWIGTHREYEKAVGRL